MKKRILMILMIVLVILLIPRYNHDGHRAKIKQGQSFPNGKILKDTDDFELPAPGILSLINFVSYNRPGNTHALKTPFIASNT